MGMNPRTLRPANTFTPRSISGLALWLDASASGDLYTTDAGPVTAVSSPTEISGCVGWWDASDASTLLAADTGSTLATTTVGRWANKGTLGSAADLLQSTAGSRPATGSNTRNGRNVLSFDGTDDWMQRSFTLAQPCTAFIVFSYSSAYSATTTLIDGAGAGNTLRFAPNSNTDAIFVTGGTTPQFNLSAWGAMNAWQQASFVANGSASASLARRNGLQAVNGSGATATATNPNGLTVASWGAFGLQYANAQYAEIVVFNSALSAADIARVESYLAAKWGIAGVHAAATSASDPVGYWRDRSGRAANVVTATAANRPLVGSENGRRALTFDGTNDNLNSTPLATVGASAVTHIAVVKNNLTSQPAFLSAAWALNSGNAGRPIERWQSASQNRIYTSDSTATDITSPFRSLSDRFVHIMDGQRDGVAVNQHRVREFINGAQIFSVTGASAAWSTTGQKFNIGTRDDNGVQYKGNICEVLCYDKILSASERQRLERYLAAKWGIVLAPQVSNADAQDWINRVYANGGTVTASTAAAVNQFCLDIENAPGGSIRDRFYRLNLFAGTGLNACLVPLYRGPSLGGTQFGGATDTNNGPFLPADYNETGATGGLWYGGVGNNASKYLLTGVAQSALTASSRHLSVYEIAKSANSFDALIGSDNGVSVDPWLLTSFSTPTSLTYLSQANASGGQTITSGVYTTGAHWIGNSPSSTSAAIYQNGTSVASSSGMSAATPGGEPIAVFGIMRAGSFTDLTNARIGAYSIGLAFTPAQAAAYYTAMQAFQTALQRNV